MQSSLSTNPSDLDTSSAPSACSALDFDFTAFHREFAPFVWRNLRRLGVDGCEVEDASQEVFVVVHRRFADYDGRAPLRSWVFGICLRVASDFRRHTRRLREEPIESFPEPSMAAPQADALDRHRARALVDHILNQLDDEKRAVFVLFELEQFSMREVCEAVDCPLQTAYSRLHAARKHVEGALKRATAQAVRP
ncbi:MAG: hypothetical protein NVS3B20_02890 [Polyangiales bacterium]